MADELHPEERLRLRVVQLEEISQAAGDAAEAGEAIDGGRAGVVEETVVIMYGSVKQFRVITIVIIIIIIIFVCASADSGICGTWRLKGPAPWEQAG